MSTERPAVWPGFREPGIESLTSGAKEATAQGVTLVMLPKSLETLVSPQLSALWYPLILSLPISSNLACDTHYKPKALPLDLRSAKC